MRNETRNNFIFLTFLATCVACFIVVVRHHQLSDICACERGGSAICACFERVLIEKTEKRALLKKVN